MPLSDEAPALIRANLEQLQAGNRVSLLVIGALTDTQLDAINDARRAHDYPPIVAEVVFIGRHVYESRILRDGYTIDDVIDQIASSMEAAAVVIQTPTMTANGEPGLPSRPLRERGARQSCFRMFRQTPEAGALLCGAEGRPHKAKKATQE